jgi:hypothetical protein
MRTLVVSAILSATAALAPAAASIPPNSCEPASSPLLETIEFVPARFSAVPFQNLGDIRIARLLCKDGRVVVMEIMGEPATLSPSFSPAPPFPFTAFLSAGRVTADFFTSLLKAMGDAQIGLRSDCFISLDPLLGQPSLKITWFGRRGRSNTFRVNGVGSDPPCPDAVLPLVLDIILQLGPAPGGSEIVIE